MPSPKQEASLPERIGCALANPPFQSRLVNWKTPWEFDYSTDCHAAFVSRMPECYSPTTHAE